MFHKALTTKINTSHVFPSAKDLGVLAMHNHTHSRAYRLGVEQQARNRTGSCWVPKGPGMQPRCWAWSPVHQLPLGSPTVRCQVRGRGWTLRSAGLTHSGACHGKAERTHRGGQARACAWTPPSRWRRPGHRGHAVLKAPHRLLCCSPAADMRRDSAEKNHEVGAAHRSRLASPGRAKRRMQRSPSQQGWDNQSSGPSRRPRPLLSAGQSGQIWTWAAGKILLLRVCQTVSTRHAQCPAPAPWDPWGGQAEPSGR